MISRWLLRGMTLLPLTFITFATERRDESAIFYRRMIVDGPRLSDPLQCLIVVIHPGPCQFITTLHLFQSDFMRLFNSSFELNQIGAFPLIAFGAQEVRTPA